MDELFDREGAAFELPGIGSAILKSNLGCFQAALVHDLSQAAIAEGHAVNVGGQILERSLAISDGQAMHHPSLRPDFVGDF